MVLNCHSILPCPQCIGLESEIFIFTTVLAKNHRSSSTRVVSKKTRMAPVTHISSSTQFTSILKSSTYVVADFYADWCGPCKVIAPVFEQLASSHSRPGRLIFVKVDVDAHQDIAQKYGVSAYVVARSGKQP